MNSLFKSVLVVCLVLMGISGCDVAGGGGSVKFDGTSAAASRESLQKMTAGLSDDEKKAFIEAATAVAFRMNEGTGNTASPETMWKGLTGLTKSEIEAKSKEIQAK
ncbi:MAG: hypothetical protein JSS02_00045 [Planctomycetes bacterium]|nr:hypothetical protein [Planctomycetota bacterium]